MKIKSQEDVALSYYLNQIGKGSVYYGTVTQKGRGIQ